jgi:hypothetical protein
MAPLVPPFLYPLMLYSSLLTMAVLLFGLNRSLKLANWLAADRTRAVWSAAALLALAYAAAAIPSRHGFYHGPAGQIPTIQFGLLGPIIISILLFRWWPALRRAVLAVPQQWLVGLQLFRIEGAIFLILYAMHRLPPQFAMPAGIGDVLVGLAAPFVAIAYLRKGTQANGLILVWNLLGLLDLVTAVTTGMLTSPIPIHVFTMDAPNELISLYPLVMVPVFLVPLAFLLHFASLQRLRRTEPLQQNQHAILADRRA